MTQDGAGPAPMPGSTLAEVGLRDATVGYGLRMGLSAESIACLLASDKARAVERLVELESDSADKNGGDACGPQATAGQHSPMDGHWGSGRRGGEPFDFEADRQGDRSGRGQNVEREGS